MNAVQFQKKLLGMQENMMNFALQLTADKDDAQDLMQDTTLKVLRNREKFVDNVSFKGWIFTVMRNIFINNYHKLVRSQTIIDQNIDLYNLDAFNVNSSVTPDSVYQMQEIIDIINTLSPEMRIPFTLFVSGYKYSEIAQQLHIPLGTIKSRIFFARHELQKRLKDFN